MRRALREPLSAWHSPCSSPAKFAIRALRRSMMGLPAKINRRVGAPGACRAERYGTTMIARSMWKSALCAVLALAGAAGAARAETVRIAQQYGVSYLPLMVMRDAKLLEA